MKRVNYFIVITLLLCNLGWAQSLQIETKDIKITVGDSVQLAATFFNFSNAPVDTAIVWSVFPVSLGEFKENGLFIAAEKGKGNIIASVGDVSANTKLQILSAQESDEEIEDWNPLSIVPKDTSVSVGDIIQFKAFFATQEDVVVDTTGTWNIEGDSIGTITQDGLFTAAHPGVGYVYVELDSLIASSFVIVTEAPLDTASAHNIYIARVLPSGKVLPPRKLKEGQVFTIGGLPHPLNILNGGLIYFPSGCLKEDITIQIQLPDNAKDNGKEVLFEDQILNGVTFNVFVNDTLVSPYYFEQPLSVALPFKRGLVKQYNLTLEKLSMFYQQETGMFTNVGISNVVVDSASNRILARVEHFSTLVLCEGETSTRAPQNDAAQPQHFTLLSNYPNPFNPSTLIHYTVPNDGLVTLKVFDLLGKEIVTLVNDYRIQGQYNVKWTALDHSGNSVAGGIYFLTLKTENYRQTKRIIYLR